VIILFAASLCFSGFTLGLSKMCSSPGRLLSGTVHCISQVSSHAGSVYCTDLILASCAVLPSLQGFAGRVSPGATIFLRSIFFLSLVFFVA